MLRHKSGSAESTTKPQARQLSQHLTFLDVIRDCCARGGRFTLTADSGDGRAYTVLVDRGGPFNVSGDGIAGSEALVAASRLNSGTYVIAEGWPVAQPLYQIGLDATLQMLARETMPTVVGTLPAPRGVDTLRNSNAATAPPVGRAPAAAEPPLMASLMPVSAENAVVVTDPLAPGGATVSADQGGFRNMVTQAILWLVQVDEPERYSLSQARVLLARALAGSFRGLFHPFSRHAAARWQQAKVDWEKSGEVAAKQRARRSKPRREIDVDPRSGPLSGPRR